jgi:Xaa-Pro aminopeptidase
VTDYASRAQRLTALADLLESATNVAMEYSPQAALPLASRVDAGTLELVRNQGVEVVSSADLVAYATARWSPEQLASHRRTAQALTETVHVAFAEAGRRYGAGVTEGDVAQFIRRTLASRGLAAPDGPIVAVNAHASDPHYEPPLSGSSPIRPGDWLLIDLWAREEGAEGVYADITWTAYVGSTVPERMQRVFDVVIGARYAAVIALERAFQQGRSLQGWEVDKVARDFVDETGYGAHFTHRLGHSIGREVHGNGPNLDGFETLDTRLLVEGMGFSVEPGVYLPDFGVRSEIDVYLGPQGPEVTTPPQREVVRIG